MDKQKERGESKKNFYGDGRHAAVVESARAFFYCLPSLLLLLGLRSFLLPLGQSGEKWNGRLARKNNSLPLLWRSPHSTRFHAHTERDANETMLQ